MIAPMQRRTWIGIGLACLIASAAIADDAKPSTDPAKGAKPAKDAPPPAAAQDPQFVDPDDWFFVPHPENSRSQKGQLQIGKKKPSCQVEFFGATGFWNSAQNACYEAFKFWQTRPAKPEDLTLGRKVVYPFNPITSKSDKEAQTSWGYRQIVNLVDAPKGQAIVAGVSNPLVDRATMRVILGGDPDPTIAMTGTEDAQHFHPEHWLVFVGEGAPDADGFDAKLAIAIKAPAKKGEEGTFLVISSGDVIKTKFAYHSHPATRAELKAGLRVAVFTAGGDLPDREGAYGETWYVGNLGEVTPSVIRMGKGTKRVEILRIIE